jgi:carbonic anhydrase
MSVHRTCFLVAVAYLGVLLSSSGAQEKTAPTADQALLRLKEGNERFAQGMTKSKKLDETKRQVLAKGQSPFAVVLACADSRVTPEYIFNQGLGDLFVLRVAGNISDPFMLGSVEFAVENLKVPLIVVLGHENCGAVAAALGDKLPGGNLGKLVQEIHPGKDLPAGRKEALAKAVANNSEHQAELMTSRSELIKKYVDEKKVRIVSGVYGLSTGKVEWLPGK